jgi:hypothetical protein
MKSLAKDNDTEVCFPNFSAQLNVINNDTIHNPQLNYANDYAGIFKNLKILQSALPITKYIEVPFQFQDIVFEDGANYNGFFQCEKFFMHNRDFILEMFEPNDTIKKYITEKYAAILSFKTCAIHVRRGDFLKFSHIHTVQDLAYYQSGIKALQMFERYVVFSDDIAWCKNNFIGENFIFIENEKDYIDLFLMSMCDNQIISNSSFSWWAAWLNNNPDKKVVAPIKWFNNNSLESKDIIPESWIKL